MKVVVQNRAVHSLSHTELEAMVKLFPSTWSRLVKAIMLAQSNGTEVAVTFHPKERVLGLHWPRASVSTSKLEAIEALLASLVTIAERGDLPKRVSPSLRAHMLEKVSYVREHCLAVIDANAGKMSAP